MNRVVTYLVAPLTSLLVLSASSVAIAAAEAPEAKTAGGACVAETAKTALNACAATGPTNFDVTKHGKAPTVNFHSAPPPADLKKRDQQTKPNAPSEQMSASQRDERKNKLQARAKALLVTEISGLENLFRTTPKNAPDRPTLARRLAEDYVELESAAFREKTQAEIDRDSLKKTNPAAAGQKQTAANQANTIMSRARQKAEENYNLIRTDYPNYPQLDEVLYYLAYEYEQANDYQNARKVYYELIQKRPDSKYIPNAYLAFGELFFVEAQGDPSKFELARQSYVKVLEYPAATNKVWGYAQYKLGYTYWNMGEKENLTKALTAFKSTIEYSRQYAAQPGVKALGNSARKDIVPVYALIGKPEGAYAFFKPLTWRAN